MPLSVRGERVQEGRWAVQMFWSNMVIAQISLQSVSRWASLWRLNGVKQTCPSLSQADTVYVSALFSVSSVCVIVARRRGGRRECSPWTQLCLLNWIRRSGADHLCSLCTPHISVLFQPQLSSPASAFIDKPSQSTKQKAAQPGWPLQPARTVVWHIFGSQMTLPFRVIQINPSLHKTQLHN